MKAAALVPIALLALAPAPAAPAAPPEGPASAAIVVPPPPPTPAVPFKETLHGVTIEDDYRWLEGDDSNPAAMGAMTPQVAAWTAAQNAYTRSVLDGLPGRRELEAKLLPLMEVGTVGLPTMRAKRYFYLKREGSQNQPVLYYRDGQDGAANVLLDPAKLDASGLTTIAGIAPTADGTLVAYESYRAGNERSTLHVLDVESGGALPLEIPGKVEDVSWLPDGSGFFYRNLANVDDPYSGQVRFHRMGTEVHRDPLVLAQVSAAENAKLATTDGPSGEVSRDGRWLLLSYATSSTTNDLWVADAQRFLKAGRLERQTISVGDDAQSYGRIVGNTLYMVTTVGAPHGRVVAVNLKRPQRDRWRVLVPERADATIEELRIGRGTLVVRSLVAASDRVELYDLDGRPKGTVALPGLGTARVAAEPDRTEAFVDAHQLQLPADRLPRRPRPPRGGAGALGPREGPGRPGERPRRAGLVPVEGRHAREPCSSCTGRASRSTGRHPALLTGYGGFDISETPRFDAHALPVARAPAASTPSPTCAAAASTARRGIGRGCSTKKQNVFDDFIAAAEYLIARRLHQPGAARHHRRLERRPPGRRRRSPSARTSSAAVVCAVPLLDMLRYQDFLMAASTGYPSTARPTTPTSSSTSTPTRPTSTCRPAPRYPAVLLTAAENDTRVHPLHARKMTAALQRADASDQSEKPILLWVESEAGHGPGKPLSLRLRDVVDQRIFIMWQLGMLPAEPTAPPAPTATPNGRNP